MYDFTIDDGVLIRYYGDDTGVVIPDFVSSIDVDAFKAYWRLKLIYIPDSVKFIGKEVFGLCNSLTSASIPHNCTVAKDAFCPHCNVLRR